MNERPERNPRPRRGLFDGGRHGDVQDRIGGGDYYRQRGAFGRTADANLPFLAKSLNALGVRVREARIIPDDEDTIVATVNACRETFDYVLTTGGIGPTHDDITAASIAKAFGVPSSATPARSGR